MSKRFFISYTLKVCICAEYAKLICAKGSQEMGEIMRKEAFTLVKETIAQIFIEETDKNYDGLMLVAEAFAGDVEMITGKRPEIITKKENLQGEVVIVGTIGENSLINTATNKGILDIEGLVSKRECYNISLVDNLTQVVNNALIITGSDKRGCIYGLFHISELIGVSPWVWFADAFPRKQENIVLTKEEVEMTSKEPSIRFRGIFINDESPSFTSWAKEHYGELNEKMYAHIFELILRLKGNYLWPAMWNNNFSEDGADDIYANIKLANTYGIVMGTSHHEPMCRAGVEWQRIYENYSDSNEWDFKKNRKAIPGFWRDGITRNKDYENVITLGMRGENDSSLGGSMAYNVQSLKDIILTQKEILKEAGLTNSPKMLVVYKEVEQYWNGGIDTTTGEEVEGLKDWKNPCGTSPLDDIIIMLCEDNYGNVRSLPRNDRKGGWGMYYHFDYNGGPRGYMWVNVMQLEKTWEQLSQTYDYGVRDCWIVNVGDLKPMEMQISYYMDLAYDFDTYGTNLKVTPEEYYRAFVGQQFTYGLVDKDVDGIAKVLSDYCKLNQMCRPEYAREDIYSLDNYAEAPRILAWCIDIEKRAALYQDRVPVELKDAYYQLVYYPAVASANVAAMYIYLAYNRKYAAIGSEIANRYGMLFDACVDYDMELADDYNNTMSNGKWKGMMLQNHYGYTSWHHESIVWPKAVYVKGNCVVDNQIDVVKANKAVSAKEVPEIAAILSDLHTEENKIIKLNKQLQKEAELAGLPVGTYMGYDGVVSISAEDFVRSYGKEESSKTFTGIAAWNVIPNYGRYTASIKVYPTTISYSTQGDEVEGGERSSLDTPYVEYSLYIKEDGEYTLLSYTSPSNNLDGDCIKLRYGVSFDYGNPRIVNTLPNGFVAGDCIEPHWCKGVDWNIHETNSTITLIQGLHILRFYYIDPGLVLQKLVLYKGELPKSYLGPQNSYKTQILLKNG